VAVARAVEEYFSRPSESPGTPEHYLSKSIVKRTFCFCHFSSIVIVSPQLLKTNNLVFETSSPFHIPIQSLLNLEI
jgi:hypothetical protein